MSRAPIDSKKIFTGIKDTSLRFFSPGDREGSLLVQPPKQVFEDGDLEWRLSLVGQYIGSAPNFGAMEKDVDMLWGKVLKVKVSLAGPNLYVFVFSSADARDWLYNMPLELFNKTGPSYIASALRNPLYMDSVTANRERLEYVKVCVEIGACSSIPKFIDVLLRDGRVHHVRVVVPWLLPSCSKCKVFGHSEKSCSVKEVGTSQVWRQNVLVVCDDRFTASELGESSLQSAAQSELVVPVIEGDVCATSVLGVQYVCDDIVVIQNVGEGEAGCVTGSIVCDEQVVVPIDGAEVVVDIEEQALVPMDGAAVDADADFPSFQASVHKKKGRGRPMKEKKVPSQVVLV
ncbi:hypothetical protein V6N13_065553 [Hibiscus sabdariffa]